MALNLRAIAVAAAQRAGIDPQIFLKQINQESGFDPNAKSSAGAEGIAQFMPATAAGYHINPFDPVQALQAAAKMDAGNLRKYGSYARMLSAYNSGEPDAYKNPKFAGGQTYNYVRDILGGTTLPAAWGGHEGSGANIGGKAGQGQKGLPPISKPTANMNALALLAQSMQTVGNTGGLDLLSAALARAQAQAAQSTYGAQPTNGPLLAPGFKGVAATLKGAKAGGFLPANVPYKSGRLDQGHDFQTKPGAPIIAPGAGVVVAVKSDPNGFGPAYPVVHFTSGKYAGQNVYIGHTLSQLKPGQKFSPGQVISVTGLKPVGNAQVPGWAEIGFADSNGLPGSFGQSTPF